MEKYYPYMKKLIRHFSSGKMDRRGCGDERSGGSSLSASGQKKDF